MEFHGNQKMGKCPFFFLLIHFILLNGNFIEEVAGGYVVFSRFGRENSERIGV